MADNRITKHRVKNHWAYSWWKYALMAVCVVCGVNIFFATTAYRAPEDKKVEIYLCSGWADAQKAQDDLWPLLMDVDAEQEEMYVANIDLSSEDYYAVMQYSTYMAAQQGDILLLSAKEFKKYASDEVDAYFMNLLPYMQAGVIRTEELDLANVTVKDSTGEQGVFGVPADALYGLMDYGIDPAYCVLVITAYSGNEDTCAGMLQKMMEHYAIEKPDTYDAWHQQMKAKKGGTTQIYY